MVNEVELANEGRAIIDVGSFSEAAGAAPIYKLDRRCPRFASFFWTLTWDYHERPHPMVLTSRFHITARCGSIDYSLAVPRNLHRYHHTGQAHFVTFSCYRREQNFCTAKRYDLFVTVWKTCAAISECSFTDTWSCPSTFICS